MKIYDQKLTGTTTNATGRPPETQKADADGEGRVQTPASRDRVEFSSGLGALARAVSTDQSNRADRIRSLAAQVQSGTYQPDPRAISRNMLTEALAGY
jgi:anti-sigma28 factor (negative regulator of flagellin synthesis)